jgi:putative transposase
MFDMARSVSWPTSRKRTRAAKSGQQASSSKAVASPTARTARKIYSEKERAQKLGEIEKQIGRGESIKAAVQKAGISQQTYSHWKKAAGQTTPSDELRDLVKLEEENARLKKLLADRLRKENADLKKKLGLLELARGQAQPFASGASTS